jgi:hypothetical protein
VNRFTSIRAGGWQAGGLVWCRAMLNAAARTDTVCAGALGAQWIPAYEQRPYRSPLLVRLVSAQAPPMTRRARRVEAVVATDAQDYAGMDDLFIPLWPPAWLEGHTLSDEQFVAATEDVKLMSAIRSDQRILLSVSWPGGRRYLMVDPHGDGAAEAFRAGATSTDSDTARSIDAMWSQALHLAKRILDGELPTPVEPRRKPWRRKHRG